MIVRRKKKADKDGAMSDEEVIRRLEALCPVLQEDADTLARAANCIRRLSQFRDAFQEVRRDLAAEAIGNGLEVERLKAVVQDYQDQIVALKAKLKSLEARKR